MPASVSPAEAPSRESVQAPAGEAGPKGGEARATEERPARAEPKAAAQAHAGAPKREKVSPLLFVAAGPLSMGQVQVSVDGKTALRGPMVSERGPRGGSGFLLAERLNLPPGVHEIRMVLAAAKPGPFYAEATKRVALDPGPEQVLIVKAARFPARLQITGPVPRSNIPKELETAIEDKLAEGRSNEGQALAGAAAVLAQEGPADGEEAGLARIHVRMDGPLQKGRFQLFLDGERVADRPLEELPKPSGRPGFHYEGKMAARPGPRRIRAVVEGDWPHPFRAEGEGVFSVQPGQLLKLRVELESIPPRLRIVEVEG
jgi:hypothetical protein